MSAIVNKGGWKLLKAIGKNPNVIKPLGNYSVVEVFKPEKESMGGIALPDQLVDKDKQCLARILKVGPGQRALMDGTPMGMHVKEGDLVVILKHTPIEIKLGGEVFHVLAEGDIIGVVDEEALNTILGEDFVVGISNKISEPSPEFEKVAKSNSAALDENDDQFWGDTPAGKEKEEEPVDPVVQTPGGVWVPREVV